MSFLRCAILTSSYIIIVLANAIKRALLVLFFFCYFLSPPLMRENIKSTINTKNSILAIPEAAPAIPPNPNTAAIIAIMINVIVQRNIV